MPLPLASHSKLGQLSESQSRDSSPRNAVSERTRRKTNANENTDEERIEVKARLANMRERLTHVKVPRQKIELVEMMLECVVQSKKVIRNVKREDLPKQLITNLDEQKRVRQDLGLAKASSPPKLAEAIVHTPITTRPSASTFTMAMALVQEKGKRSEQKEKQPDTAQVVQVESDEKSN